RPRTPGTSAPPGAHRRAFAWSWSSWSAPGPVAGLMQRALGLIDQRLGLPDQVDGAQPGVPGPLRQRRAERPPVRPQPRRGVGQAVTGVVQLGEGAAEDVVPRGELVLFHRIITSTRVGRSG